MLVLHRKTEQRVVITVPPGTEPRQIVVHVLEVARDKVKLGFDAPPAVKILREELREKP